jgi:hypothetical protein
MKNGRMHVCLVCHTEPDVWDGKFKSIDVILPRFVDILGEITDSHGTTPRVAWCLTSQVAKKRAAPFLRLLENGHEIGVHSHYPGTRRMVEHELEINRKNLDSFQTWFPGLYMNIARARFPFPRTHVSWMFAYREPMTQVLADAGITIDCSVCYGGAHYLEDGFLLADSRCRNDGKPYILDKQDHCREGDSPVVEVPVSGGFGSCWEPDEEGRFKYFSPVGSDSKTQKMIRIFSRRLASLSPDETDIFQVHFHLYDFLTPEGIDEARMDRAGRILWYMVRDSRVCFSTPSRAVDDWLGDRTDKGEKNG